MFAAVPVIERSALGGVRDSGAHEEIGWRHQRSPGRGRADSGINPATYSTSSSRNDRWQSAIGIDLIHKDLSQNAKVYDCSHNGRLSCFFIGISTCLCLSIASARAMRRRVEFGMMTSSI